MLALLFASSVLAAEPCRVTIIDHDNRWPVPLVELRTTDGQRFVSDNAGVIAIDSPDLMNRETWFDVIGHGYDVPKDGFGFRGVRLTPKPGQPQTIEVNRSNIAKRIGRLTGGGLFAESQKCGLELDWKDSSIVGCDSVQSVTLGDRRYWFWGDTTLPGYPLGLFDTLAATTAITPFPTLAPPLRPRFDYVTKDGKPRGVAKLSGKGPTWLFGVATLPDAKGVSHLVGTYTKIENHLDVYETGLCEWVEAEKSFVHRHTIWKKSDGGKKPTLPDGHAVTWTDSEKKSWLLFGNPFPHRQCPATFEAWSDPKQWKTIQPIKDMTAVKGDKVVPHTGSIAYFPAKKIWIAIFNQKFGSSPFGEVWYAEAESPLGPWGKPVKVLTHSNYTFYNPKVHVDLTSDPSSQIYFEGTYTAEFADHAPPTPRHNYNQILYRLDTDDPRLKPAKR